MQISVSHRFVYVSNPQAGADALEALLLPHAEIQRVGSPRRQALAWAELLRDHEHLFGQPAHAPATYLKFGVVREPLAWLHARHQAERALDPALPADLTRAWPLLRTRLGAGQAGLFAGLDGRCAMDLLLPAEDLGAALPALFSRLGLPAWAMLTAPAPAPAPTDLPDGLRAEVLAQLAPDVALHRQACEGWAEALAGPRLLQLRVLPCAGAEEAFIDQFPQTLQPGEAFRLCGVVVLRPALQGPFKVVAEDVAEVGEFFANMPSAWYARKYPDRPQAGQARFLFKALRLVPGRPARLLLEAGGQRWPLFELQA